MGNHEVCEAAEKALATLVNNQHAFLQSTIFVLRAARAAYMDVELDSPAHGGFRVTYDLLDRFASNMDMTATEYIECHLFFTQISGLEFFFQSCLAAVLRAYPKKLGSAQFTLSQILEADSKDALIDQATEVFLNKLMYKKPSEYLDEICNTLSIESVGIRPFWSDFVEAKARRDVGIHNNWKCNETYLRKVSEVGLTLPFELGDSLVPKDGSYFTKTTESLGQIGRQMVEAIRKTYGKKS
jgi:hypothetical protein